MNTILTVPNLLTFLRMALIPVFASLLFYGNSIWALLVFVIAGVSDGIDGYLARRFKQESELGTIIDPIADKLLMTVAFVVLSLPHVFEPVRHLPIPFWVTAAVIGRDVLIVTVAGAIHIMTGFKGFRPSWLGKLSTFVQVIAVSLILLAAVTGTSFYLPTVYFLVVLLAVASGIHYIFQVARLMKEEESNMDTDAGREP
ncbi:CDP-alcohol phosphatidyltransferase family protein [Leptolyngbya sp. 7M]|uniref:CDP-alcohol phosphatidyltransferase family protein n=1 Tax=Leptolyngbya sp. 7M TaxID=2812896 RepID=UPI001B8CE299|nr:CDP-alcohol phosphatidyltransferase family protein [Leptolyngbya sp. 7M]QYO65623.1 CDP-alcohol phosphatidyltransferase family protein [Leptolyngbya sp. 7M]